MPNFHRFYIPDSVVFITCVTQDRYPYLKSKEDVDLFFETISRANEINPFELLAYVILPDHFHWLMKVDDPAGNFSKIMHSIKRNFTINFKNAHNINSPLSIWQKRYWDHVIRDDNDLERHFDYFHWNPVKHGHVVHPELWPHSTYRDWIDKGYYEVGWGWSKEPDNIIVMDFE